MAYAGVVKYLEEVNILSNGDHPGQIKRFAGTSAGALTASLLALGYRYEELHKILSVDVKEVFHTKSKPNWWKFWTVLSNLRRSYGMTNTEAIKEFISQKIISMSTFWSPDIIQHNSKIHTGTKLNCH